MADSAPMIQPPWLVPAQPPAQPQAAPDQGKGASEVGSPAVAPAQPRPNEFGFAEVRREAWPFDGGKRREPVLDHDFHPPLIVRKVGWNRCMCCAKPFWSEDVTAVRLCHGCKETRDRRAGVGRGSL